MELTGSLAKPAHDAAIDGITKAALADRLYVLNLRHKATGELHPVVSAVVLDPQTRTFTAWPLARLFDVADLGQYDEPAEADQPRDEPKLAIPSGIILDCDPAEAR